MSNKRSTLGEVPQSIRMVSKLTGLKPHVIRVWERRYGAVAPERTATNRRMYSPAEVARLTRLRRATELGHSIGDVATLPCLQLNALLVAGACAGQSSSPMAAPPDADPAKLVETAFGAVEAMDTELLERTLDQASVAYSPVRVLNEVVVPLVRRIGLAWEAGRLKVAHEHLASAVIRTFLGQAAKAMAPHAAAPRILVTTPAGQLHELGAAMASVLASQSGWRVIFAGAAMPAPEIAAAALKNRVRVVALSVIYPADDPELGPELMRLRKLLPAEMCLIIGGRAIGRYRKQLRGVDARWVESLEEFRDQLAELRA